MAAFTPALVATLALTGCLADALEAVGPAPVEVGPRAGYEDYFYPLQLDSDVPVPGPNQAPADIPPTAAPPTAVAGAPWTQKCHHDHVVLLQHLRFHFHPTGKSITGTSQDCIC